MSWADRVLAAVSAQYLATFLMVRVCDMSPPAWCRQPGPPDGSLRGSSSAEGSGEMVAKRVQMAMVSVAQADS